MAMFINTGLILLITNIDFNYNSPSEISSLQFLFGGKYSDISPEWFKNVGTVILLTIAINTVSTPLVLIMFNILRQISQLCDRGKS